MAKHGLTGRLKNSLLTGILAGYIGLAGCGGSSPSPPPPPPTPSISQTVSLVNDVDIDYKATLTNVSQATRTIKHNGTQISTTTLTTSPYTEILSNRIKGDYLFNLTSGNLSDTDPLTIPNYLPASNFSSLGTNLNERYVGSSKTFNLETLLSDKNPEDRPVLLASARSLDGKTQVSLNGYNLTITAAGATGPYQVEVNFGSDAGGLGSSVIAGQIIAVPEQIAFTGFIGSNFDIYLGDLTGNGLTNIQRLTTDPAQDFESAWSPASDKIIFTSNRDSRNRIYSMDLNGNNQQVISPLMELAWNPVWCSDQNSNQKILFSYVDSGRTGIASVNPDGTGFKSLVEEPFSGVITGNPTCSKSGLEFAFSTSRDGNSEVYVANLADGSNQRNLTNNPAADDQPRWSSDNKISFITDRDTPGQAGELNLYLINPDSTGLHRLTNFSGREMDLSWSPDSNRFAFTKVTAIGDPFHIYIINTDGTGLTQLTTQGQNIYPAWRPK